MLVLDQGRAVQRGSYAELAAADGPFRRMLERERAVDAAYGEVQVIAQGDAQPVA